MHLLAKAAFAAALALSLTASTVSANPLFKPLEKGSTRARAALLDTAYRALAQDPAMADLHIVAVEAAQVTRQTREIRLDLAPGLQVTARQIDSYRTKDGLIVWHGLLLDSEAGGSRLDPFDTVTLVRNGGKLTGNVRSAGKWYHIRPLRRGGHALVAVKVDEMPAEHAPGASMPVVPAPSPLISAAAASTSAARTTIRLMVNYTALAATATGDILGLITLAVAETNQSYVNSGVQRGTLKKCVNELKAA